MMTATSMTSMISMTSRRRLLGVSVVVILLAAGGLAWFLSRGDGIVGETLALQQRLLAGESTGRDLKVGVSRVIKNVDKMNRADVKTVRNALTGDWRRLQQAGIDEYFEAEKVDRESVLDRDLRRLAAVAELWFATNPRSSGTPPRRPASGKNKAVKPVAGAVKPAADPQAKLFEIYRTALMARGLTLGISVPEWLLEPPRR